MVEVLQQQKRPLYVLSQKIVRILLPQTILLLLLGIVFYFGILLNLSLLDLRASQEMTVRTLTLIVLLILIVLGVILAFRKAKTSYQFYQDRLIFGRKFRYYREITNIQRKQNILDKIFHTYSLVLGGKFIITGIPENIDIESYVRKLVAYANQYNLPKI